MDNLKRPQLLWIGSALARHELREIQKPWQLVNRFPRGGSMGSKSSLLQNLRAFCEKSVARPLVSFFPRAYDLRKPRELYVFILDFAVTRAEAMLQTISSRPVGTSDCKHILAATRLLERLVPLLERESNALHSVLRPRGYTESEIICLFEAELAIVTSTDWQSTLEGDSSVPVVDSPDAAIIAALKMEVKWWLNHLQQASYRQFQFNGKRAFWILKEPSLNCGRGVSVFCDLLPLLAQSQEGGWDFVVQKYLERPLLVGFDGRKCDVRLWVLITSWNPAVVWVWSEPYLRLASRPFSWAQDQVTNPFVHLTNRTVQKEDGEKTHVEQRSEDEEHIWMLSSFFSWAIQGGHRTPDDTGLYEKWVAHTWPRMLDAVRACVRSCQVDVGSHQPGCFELFGFDFLLDEDLEPWLLEANSSPDLCEDGGPSLRKLTEDAITQLCQLVPSLHNNSIDMPSNLDSPECDLQVDGSGLWHLCLFERKQCDAKEMELRRILKPCPHTTRLGTPSRHVFSPEHFEVLRSVLGSHLACVLPEYKTTSSPGRDVRRRPQSIGSIARSPHLKGLPCENSVAADKKISHVLHPRTKAFEQLGSRLSFGERYPSKKVGDQQGTRRARSYSRTR